ncbi:MAG: glycosyltransferase family 39 protein [Dehalococcoidia bacterium]|nr:glycosyltransferase family 39 protein [Dehalococcoidia bacterium]
MISLVRLALVVTLLAAFALRVVGLGTLPPGLHSDEAVDGLDALSGVIAPFYPANNGREGLFALLLAPSVALLGREPLALRLPMAFCGVLSVAAAFALGRRLFRSIEGGTGVAVAAAALMGVSLFPALLNRFGVRVSLLPLLAAIAALLFWRAREQGSWRAWAVAGAAAGIAQYAYTSARLLPLILFGFSLLADFLRAPPGSRARWGRNWAVFGTAAGIVLLPLALVALTQPALFFQRTVQLLSRFVEPFPDRLLKTVGMFVVAGDPKPVHNLPGEPMFGAAVAPFAFLGLLLALRQWYRPPYGFLLLWLAIGTLAAALPREHKPHFLHAMILAPAVFFFPALGLAKAAAWTIRRGAPPVLPALASGALVAGVFLWSAWRMAVLWPAVEDLRLHFWTDVVREARRWREEPLVIVVVNARYNPHDLGAVVRFIAGSGLTIVPTDDALLPARLEAAVGEAREVLIVLPDPALTLGAAPDPKGAIDTLLASASEAAEEWQSSAGTTVRYRLDRRLRAADRPVEAKLGEVWLRRWTGARRDTVGTISLLWSVDQPPSRPLKVSARLVDSTGRTLAQDDREIVSSGQLLPISAWQPGEAHRTYHLLEIPHAAGPLGVRLIVYDAASGIPVAPPYDLGPLD